MAAGASVRTGMPRRRRVAAAHAIAGEAATQMDPVLADSDTIAAYRLEVAGHWGHRRSVEMGTGSHSPAPFFAPI
jgi:hypothetical protein